MILPPGIQTFVQSPPILFQAWFVWPIDMAESWHVTSEICLWKDCCFCLRFSLSLYLLSLSLSFGSLALGVAMSLVVLWRSPCSKELRTSANSHVSELRSGSSCPGEVLRDCSPRQQLDSSLSKDRPSRLPNSWASETEWDNKHLLF